MANRKALLIGVEHYGEGFAPLPAVRQDIHMLGDALRATGYEVEICPEEDLSNPTQLDARIRAFCSSGGPDDVRLIYYTGHGIRADDADWVIPARVTRHDALVSTNQRIATDLSKAVNAARTGLVLFVIDACRDEADAPAVKGSTGWGDPAHLARPGEHRFIRFFGCAALQVCQVITAKGEPAQSLFTKSLAECLAAGEAVSLQDMLSKVEARCAALLAKNLQFRPQTPRLSYGELSVEKREVLERPIFEKIQPAGLQSTWPQFDPNKLHCLVVLSERQAAGTSDWGPAELVRDALTGATGERIWKAFRQAANGLQLLSGRKRQLTQTFEPVSFHYSAFSVLDAFASWDSLDKAVRMIVEADLILFDITGFEPGIMLLLGIRSACRRWLTICSHGAGWEEGQPLELPFSLQDLNINSHTPRTSRVGALDPVVDRFVRRVEIGFLQASRHPNYQDLPSYDPLRQIGSHYSAASTIALSERILLLCPYAESHLAHWRFIVSSLKQRLWQKAARAPHIERIIDYGTPQLIQQALYEQIRRTAICVADWTLFKASVFLELGVRLTVSEWGAIQLIDDRHLPGGTNASKLAQVERMSRLLRVIPYRLRDDTSPAFERAVSLMLERNPNLDSNAEYNRIHRAVLAVIGDVEAAQPSVVQQLQQRADALHHPEQGRVGAPQILFHGSRQAKQDSESAAREARIAAWLYLDHRLRVKDHPEHAALLQTYQELGRSAANALYNMGDEDSITLAAYIEDRLAPRT